MRRLTIFGLLFAMGAIGAMVATKPAPETASKGTTYQEGILEILRIKSGEGGQLDFDAIRRAQIHRDEMPVAHVGYQQPGSNAPAAPWMNIGPFRAKPPFPYCYGPFNVSGRKAGIAVAKGDSNTIWTVGRGGAYKSIDYGQTWTNMSVGWKFSNANCVVIDPVDKNIVYVGTGDFADGGGFGSLPFGIMKTTDGGVTWSNYGDLTTFAVDETIIDIVIAPWNRNILICMTRSGNRLAPGLGKIYRSENAGMTWIDTGLPAAQNTDLAVSISEVIRGITYYSIFAANDLGTVFRTTDGVDWTEADTTPGGGYVHLACSKLDRSIVYAVSATGMLKRSTNYGDTWVDYNSSGFPLRENGQSNWAQMSYNSFVGVAKLDADTERIWVGNLSCATRTTDSSTWTDVSKSYWDTARVHADHQSFANDPNSDLRVYIGTDGGIYRNFTSSPTTVVGLNDTLSDFQCYSIDVHPTLPDFVMVGCQDNAVMATRGNLAAWTGLDAWDGGSVAFDKVNPERHYTSSQGGGAYKYGYTFMSNTSNLDITPTGSQLVSAPFIPSIVTTGSGSELLMGTGRMLRYPGVGTTWITGFDAPAQIRKIASLGNTVFFGTSLALYRSPDKGATAVNITGTLPARGYGAIYMKSTNEVIVGFNDIAGGLYRSTNALATPPTWSSARGSGRDALPVTPINAIAVDPYNGNRWYVGTDMGLFMTSNSGTTWANCNTQGFPNVAVQALKTAHNYLYAATAGRGVFRIKIGPSVGLNISGAVRELAQPMTGVRVKLTQSGPVEGRVGNSTRYAIPDNSSTGVTSSVAVAETRSLTSLKVFVHITHPRRGDIQIDLREPDGTLHRLKNTAVDNNPDVVATYTVPFAANPSGTWQLVVKDLASLTYNGTLDTWSLIYTYDGINTIAETLTDTNGNYFFSAIPSGTYFASASKPGKVFLPILRTIVPSANGEDFNSLVPSAFTLSKTNVIGGNPLVGTLTLTGTPFISATVNLSDNGPATIVPQSVNMTTAGPTDFDITTLVQTSPATSTITASLNGVSRTASVTVHPVPVLLSITAAPSPIYGGTPVSGTVTLAAAAPADTVVTMIGYNPDILPTTGTITIPQGQSSANFNAVSVAVATPRTRYLRANLGSQVKSTPILMEPAPYISGWSFNPNPVIAGQPTTGTVQLLRPVVNAPVRVFLSDNSAKVSMPEFVDIPIGQTTVTFPTTTLESTSTTFAGCYATFTGEVGTKYVKLTLLPTLKIASFSFAPNPVQGGQGTTGTVVLANPALLGPVRVFLTDNSAKFSMPAFVDVAQGQTTATFAATTLTTVNTTYAGCYASFAGNVGTKYVKVTITP